LGGGGRWISEFEASLVYRVPRQPGLQKKKKKKKKREREREDSPCSSGPSSETGAAAVAVAAKARVMAGQAFEKPLLLSDRVLVERSASETVTIMLPEKSQGKVLQATIVAVGSGKKGKSGEIGPVSVKVGDKVLPEYGGTKVVLDDKDYFLFRDSDILGKYVD
jgi:chaperonin GroES